MQEREQLVEKRPKNRMRKLKLVAGSLAFSLLPIGAGAGMYINGDPLLLPRSGVSYITEDSCTTTPPADEVIKMVTIISEHIQEPPFTNYAEQITFANQQAEKYGLTLVNPFPFERKMDETKNIDQALGTLNEFMKNFGFEFEFPTEFEYVDIGFPNTPANKEEINLEDFKANSIGLIDIFALIPTEIGKLSGINKIKFVDIPKDSEIAGAYSYIEGNAYLAYNKSSIYQFLDLIHEVSHGLDRQICGQWGSERDSEFTGLNNSENFIFNYGSSDPSQQYVIRAHGSRNMKEDKATILEYVIPGFAQYEKYGPVLQEKIVLLIARLESKIPGITSYLRAISANGQI